MRATRHENTHENTFEDLSAYDVSEDRGFLPSEDPLRELAPAFAPWEETARDLPKLLLSGRIHTILDRLPAISTAPLQDDAALRRAMLLLSYLGHAYVWGEETPSATIPASIAVPWCEVAMKVGRPPVLSYASYALDNWRRIDPDGPIELGNIMILQNFLGGADEDWFIAVHVDIEAKAARIVKSIASALPAAAKQDNAALARHLADMAMGVNALVDALKHMPELCDPYIYYRRVRPYIHGWKNHPALPEGVRYDEVESFGQSPQVFRGESGAQSSIVPAIDGALGVVHSDDPLRAYLLEMRAYMPPGHRAFVQATEAAPSIRQFVRDAGGAAGELREAYNDCLHWVEAFRTIHLEYAATYIHRQSQSGAANPTEVGTAGTPFMAYLKKHRDESADQKIVAA